MTTKKFRFLVTPALHRAIRADAALRDARISDVVADVMSDFIDNQRSTRLSLPVDMILSGERQIFVEIDSDLLERIKNDASRRGIVVSQMARIALAARYAGLALPETLAPAGVSQ